MYHSYFSYSIEYPKSENEKSFVCESDIKNTNNGMFFVNFDFMLRSKIGNEIIGHRPNLILMFNLSALFDLEVTGLDSVLLALTISHGDFHLVQKN